MQAENTRKHYIVADMLDSPGGDPLALLMGQRENMGAFFIGPLTYVQGQFLLEHMVEFNHFFAASADTRQLNPIAIVADLTLCDNTEAPELVVSVRDTIAVGTINLRKMIQRFDAHAEQLSVKGGKHPGELVDAMARVKVSFKDFPDALRKEGIID